jgi:hypothetical protein
MSATKIMDITMTAFDSPFLFRKILILSPRLQRVLSGVVIVEYPLKGEYLNRCATLTYDWPRWRMMTRFLRRGKPVSVDRTRFHWECTFQDKVDQTLRTFVLVFGR